LIEAEVTARVGLVGEQEIESFYQDGPLPKKSDG
jgi:hypothetical protein